MPVEIARRLRPEHLPKVIIVTARDPGDLPADAAVFGAIGKPVTPSSLLDAILRALGHSGPTHSRRALRAEESRAVYDQLRGAHLLLVEDNELDQELAVDLLRNAGISLRVAANGREALDWLERERFDGVLMDLQMPVMDGYAATRAIRLDPRWRGLPVIAMTANVMAGDREKALAAGLDDHIGKPLDVARMFQTLAQWIKPRGAAPQPDRPPATQALPPGLPATLPGIDLQRGLEGCDGKPQIYLTLLRLFAQGEADFAARFARARQEGDPPPRPATPIPSRAWRRPSAPSPFPAAARELEQASPQRPGRGDRRHTRHRHRGSGAGPRRTRGHARKRAGKPVRHRRRTPAPWPRGWRGCARCCKPATPKPSSCSRRCGSHCAASSLQTKSDGWRTRSLTTSFTRRSAN